MLALSSLIANYSFLRRIPLARISRRQAVSRFHALFVEDEGTEEKKKLGDRPPYIAGSLSKARQAEQFSGRHFCIVIIFLCKN